MSSSPIAVVRDFCAAWGTATAAELGNFFTDDAVYHNIPIAAVTGRDQIVATISGFAGGFEQIEFQMKAIAADGNTVLTERVDIFRSPGVSIELPVMGVFEVTDGLISAWRDYFDMQQFISQMPRS